MFVTFSKIFFKDSNKIRDYEFSVHTTYFIHLVFHSLIFPCFISNTLLRIMCVINVSTQRYEINAMYFKFGRILVIFLNMSLIVVICMVLTEFYGVVIFRDGGYTQWSSFSSCTVSCGGKVVQVQNAEQWHAYNGVWCTSPPFILPNKSHRKSVFCVLQNLSF